LLDDQLSKLAVFDLKNASNRIWNMDETGMLMEHSPSNVCIRKGTRSSRVSNSRESVTVVVCVNASGGTMSPQIILIEIGQYSSQVSEVFL
jgi:hypothetical protein